MPNPKNSIFTNTPKRVSIKQQSSRGVLDAHTKDAKDFSLFLHRNIGLGAPNSITWILRYVGDMVLINHANGFPLNELYLDAYEHPVNHNAVNRPYQKNFTQHWMLFPFENSFAIRQFSSRRYLDAYTDSRNDFSVVTRENQNNDTQRWILDHLGQPNLYSIRQKSSGRFLDAYTSQANDFSVVTRTAQNNDTQRWFIIRLGGIYTIEHEYSTRFLGSTRFLDAYEDAKNDFSTVTRTSQNNDSQKWYIRKILGPDSSYLGYTIQQISSHRFLDAYEKVPKKFSVVTRPYENNKTQWWDIRPR